MVKEEKKSQNISLSQEKKNREETENSEERTENSLARKIEKEEDYKTLQEWLDWKYPTREDKEKEDRLLISYYAADFYDKKPLEKGELDLSEYPNLEELFVDRQNITALNVKNCPKLRVLDCNKNFLTS